METQAWTVRLGLQLQALDEQSDDGEYSELQATLSHAIAQIRFVRKCYNKETVNREVQ